MPLGGKTSVARQRGRRPPQILAARGSSSRWRGRPRVGSASQASQAGAPRQKYNARRVRGGGGCMCPLVFCASKIPSFLARWRVRGKGEHQSGASADARLQGLARGHHALRVLRGVVQAMLVRSLHVLRMLRGVVQAMATRPMRQTLATPTCRPRRTYPRRTCGRLGTPHARPPSKLLAVQPLSFSPAPCPSPSPSPPRSRSLSLSPSVTSSMWAQLCCRLEAATYSTPKITTLIRAMGARARPGARMGFRRPLCTFMWPNGFDHRAPRSAATAKRTSRATHPWVARLRSGSCCFVLLEPT